jgi:hypothetical protein
MSKEWQEASNEYALVHILFLIPDSLLLAASDFLTSLRASPVKPVRDLLTHFFPHSPRRSTPSTASARRVTRARASFRAPPPRSHKWARCPIGDEQESDIGFGWGEISISHAYLDSGIFSSGHGLYSACHVVDLIADGHPVNTSLLDSSSFFVLWPTSIRKCVYPVLCYSQCISFVAIEKHVGPFCCYITLLFILFSRSFVWICNVYVWSPILRSSWYVGGFPVVRLFPGGIRNLQGWCGEPLSKRTATRMGHCEVQCGHLGE